MLIARFQVAQDDVRPGVEAPGLKVQWGVVEGHRIRELGGPPFPSIVEGKGSWALEEVNLLAPVAPTKVVAIGWNYEGHIREMKSPFPKEPLIFLKAPSSVIGSGGDVVLPPESKRVDFEAELAVVMGARCRRITRDQAPGAVFGFTALNDVTARDLQAKDGQFSRAKSFDTFCPLGPWIQTELDPTSVQVSSHVNGKLRQDDNTSTMLFDPYFIVEYVSAVMTLEPGDVIATGTPSGVGPLAAGDTVSVTVEGVGVLTSPVVTEKEAPRRP